jgi:hypothetical protein
MRRVVVLILAVCLLMCISACGTRKNEVNMPGSDIKLDVSGDPSIIEMSNFIPYTQLREGLLFVKNKLDGKIYCINKKGEIQFELINCMPSDYLSGHNGFFNGFAVVDIYDKNGMICDEYLCKTDGTIIKPQDVGCDKLQLRISSVRQTNNKLLLDGYIFALDGSKMGLLNNKLEWIRPLSEEYYSAIQSFVDKNTNSYNAREFYYENELFISENGYINIITGETGPIDEVRDKIEFPSDYWYMYTAKDIVRFSDGLSKEWETTLDLSDIYGQYVKENSLWDDGISIVYEKGMASVLCDSDNGYIFSIIDEKGNQLLKPTAVKGKTLSYDSASGIYCVEGTNSDGVLSIELFNQEGKICEHTYSIPTNAEYAYAKIEDGTIMVRVTYSIDGEKQDVWSLYDLDFQLLY